MRLTSSAPYIQGFLDGQATAYCEQVRLGSRLAGAINCGAEHAERLLGLVTREGCRGMVVPIEAGRVTLWIYRYEFVRPIIDRLAADSQGNADTFTVWAAGKLFGYADNEVAAYIAEMATGSAT